MKTMLKRWWQLAVPVAVVAAFVALTSTTQTGCGGTSCPTISGTWNLIETITTSTCSGDYPGKQYPSPGVLVGQNGCNVTFPNDAGLSGKLDGNTLTLSGSIANYFSGTLTLSSAKATISADGKSFSGTWAWTWSATSSCTGTSVITGTKV